MVKTRSGLDTSEGDEIPNMCDNCKTNPLRKDSLYYDSRLCNDCFWDAVERDEMHRAADDYYGRNDSITPPRE